MTSMLGAGEDDGKGGVVMASSVDLFSLYTFLANDRTVISYHVVHPLQTSLQKTTTDEVSPIEDYAAGQHWFRPPPGYRITDL
jgi:hypothetical protein